MEGLKTIFIPPAQQQIQGESRYFPGNNLAGNWTTLLMRNKDL